ncbi:MarR family transcriptional regulator [Promicromonospora sp. NFX87]|uniref:MarR family transcriptional regulator n=1 Tax=Promicromonospora sp. NFX87 TaxID=3402691 RepID=UPI003AFB3A23
MSDEITVTPDEDVTLGLIALADVVIELCRHLDLRSAGLRGIVPMTGTDVAVIRAIHQTPRTSPSRIAEATGLARSNVSTALRALEGRGLVVRDHPTGDGRTVEIVATPLAEEHLAQIHEFWAGRLKQAPPAIRTAALDALPALTDLLAALARPGHVDSSSAASTATP